MNDYALTNEWKQSVRENIRKGSELNLSFILMNILAATIASYGLFANSPAIIIGAMIVALLLGPIAGVGLSLVDGDNKLLMISLLSLFAGTLVVMITGFIIGLLHREIPITPEILARTSPNLIDLMVALAGGAAGAYASVSPRLSVALVGVAIATALVPPLSSASILFAHGEIELGFGAFLLTFTKMVAIQFAFSLVLWFNGFHRLSNISGLSASVFLSRNAVSISILLILAFVLTNSLHKTISQQLFEINTRTSLRKIINSSTGSHLVNVRFQIITDKTTTGKTIVRALVHGPIPPSASKVAKIEAQLPKPSDGTELELRIRFLETTIINRDGLQHMDKEFEIKE